MELKLEGLLGKASSKGCLWMDVNDQDSEGSQNGRPLHRLSELQGSFLSFFEKHSSVFYRS